MNGHVRKAVSTNVPDVSNTDFMCFLLNAQSLKNRFNFFHFEVMVQYNYPKIVLITETWLNNELPDSLFLCHERYSIYRKDRLIVKGGGVAVLVRNDLDSLLIESTLFNDLEIIACRVKCYNSDVIFACFYKPNISDVHLLEPLRAAMKFLLSFGFPVVLSGDFNLPGISWETSVAPTTGSQDKFLELFVSEGLYQHVLEPTRGSNILDLIFTNEPSLAKNVTVHPALGFSDHNMLSFSLGICSPSPRPNTTARNWDNADLIGLSLSLDVTNWTVLFENCGSVDDMWVIFRDRCSELIEEFVPLKKFNILGQKSKYPNNIKRLLRKKCVLFSKVKLKRTPANVQAYKECSKQCNRVITLYKCNSEMKLLNCKLGLKIPGLVGKILNVLPLLFQGFQCIISVMPYFR